MKYLRFLIGAGALTASLAAVAGGLPNVAIVAAAASTSTDPRFTDVQAKLMGTGRFSSVAIINASTTTPSLAELQAYDAVITWSNVNYQNATALGDVLADYVDAGGGVVVAVYANSTMTTNRRLEGRWITGGYEVIPSASGNQTGRQFLGTILVPGHPIMNGVNSFDGGTSSARPVTTSVATGSTRVAEWTDGKTLVAVGASPRRADLGFYPPSSDVSAGFWNSSTDGAILMANALIYTIGSPSSTNIRPTSFTMIRGLVISGGLSEILSSDDMYLVVRPGIVFSTSEAPVQIQVDALAPAGTASELKFKLEARANQGNLSQGMYMFNFMTGVYDVMDVRAATTTDSTVEVTVSMNASNYIGPNRELRSRLNYRATGPVFSYPWLISVDQVQWTHTQ